MAEVCDLVYVLLLEQAERWAMVERQVAAALIGAGVKMELPSMASTRAELDALLDAEFSTTQVDTRDADLRRAVGLSG